MSALPDSPDDSGPEKEVVARKGNSDTYQPAFTQPLTEGTEFELVEQRGSWMLIRLASGEDAWVPVVSGEVY